MVAPTLHRHVALLLTMLLAVALHLELSVLADCVLSTLSLLQRLLLHLELDVLVANSAETRRRRWSSHLCEHKHQRQHQHQYQYQHQHLLLVLLLMLPLPR